MATQVGFFSTPVITANRELDNSRLFLAPKLLGWSGQRAGHITTGHRDAAHGVHPGHRRYPRARLGDKRARRVVISAHGADIGNPIVDVFKKRVAALDGGVAAVVRATARAHGAGRVRRRQYRHFCVSLRRGALFSPDHLRSSGLTHVAFHVFDLQARLIDVWTPTETFATAINERTRAVTYLPTAMFPVVVEQYQDFIPILSLGGYERKSEDEEQTVCCIVMADVWQLGKLTKMSDEEMDAWSSEGDRVQWFRAQAEMQRWQEQIEQKLVELLRTARSFAKMQSVWLTLATKQPSDKPGAAAYARQKANMYKRRATEARKHLKDAGYQELLGATANVVLFVEEERKKEAKFIEQKLSLGQNF
ncbi:hypothetical protein B0H19DRAFT_1328251 [Mycena capillaripes]|nr:hypothetical protein B0H19DRAFT_1328251 [Mycena capillaripes]